MSNSRFAAVLPVLMALGCEPPPPSAPTSAPAAVVAPSASAPAAPSPPPTTPSPTTPPGDNSTVEACCAHFDGTQGGIWGPDSTGGYVHLNVIGQHLIGRYQSAWNAEYDGGCFDRTPPGAQ